MSAATAPARPIAPPTLILPPGLGIAAPPPTRYRDAEGDLRLLGRRPAMHVDGHMYCPNNHVITDVRTGLEEDTWRCSAVVDGSTCNVLLYVLAHFSSRDGTQLLWGVEVTHDEIARIRRMKIPAVLEYLDVTWRPGTRERR